MHATGDSNEFISMSFPVNIELAKTDAYENMDVHFHTVGVNASGCVLWPEEPVYTDNGVHHLLVSHHHLLTCTHTLSLPPLGSGFKLACPPRHTRRHLMGAKLLFNYLFTPVGRALGTASDDRASYPPLSGWSNGHAPIGTNPTR